MGVQLRRLSIGARWTLRIAAVMLVTASTFSAYVYERAERGIEKDAKTLIKLQLAQTLEYMEAHPDDAASWTAFAQRQVGAADPDLRLGISIFGPKGEVIHEAGSAFGAGVALPPEPLLGELREVDLGRNYHFLALARAGEEGTVQVLVYSRLFARSAARVRDAFFGALPVLLLVTAGLAWWLSRGSLRPIADMTRTARRISASQLDETIPRTGSGDELDQLAATLNDMLARVRDGVERVKRFSVDAAHQLRTPLTAMQNEIEVTLAKERTQNEYRVVLGDMLVQVATLSETVDGMLRLAQSEGGLDPAHRRRVAIDPLVEEVVEFFVALAEERGIVLSVTGESKAEVIGDPTWLHQLFANILHNALKYTPEGGRVEIAATATGTEVSVAVRDDGAGMTEEDRARVFARFQRGSASSAGDGMGLGLALAREIARAHQGAIEVESAPGRGSTFTVRLPRAPDVTAVTRG
ncbi:MAG: ATP-binding protein [Deltaproteobacteria bacterium]|nr:ATP-binding protein [Deltaproteobacteria bacterium]